MGARIPLPEGRFHRQAAPVIALQLQPQRCDQPLPLAWQQQQRVATALQIEQQCRLEAGACRHAGGIHRPAEAQVQGRRTGAGRRLLQRQQAGRAAQQHLLLGNGQQHPKQQGQAQGPHGSSGRAGRGITRTAWARITLRVWPSKRSVSITPRSSSH